MKKILRLKKYSQAFTPNQLIPWLSGLFGVRAKKLPAGQPLAWQTASALPPPLIRYLILNTGLSSANLQMWVFFGFFCQGPPSAVIQKTSGHRRGRRCHIWINQGNYLDFPIFRKGLDLPSINESKRLSGFAPAPPRPRKSERPAPGGLDFPPGKIER